MIDNNTSALYSKINDLKLSLKNVEIITSSKINEIKSEKANFNAFYKKLSENIGLYKSKINTHYSYLEDIYKSYYLLCHTKLNLIESEEISPSKDVNIDTLLNEIKLIETKITHVSHFNENEIRFSFQEMMKNAFIKVENIQKNMIKTDYNYVNIYDTLRGLDVNLPSRFDTILTKFQEHFPILNSVTFMSEMEIDFRGIDKEDKMYLKTKRNHMISPIKEFLYEDKKDSAIFYHESTSDESRNLKKQKCDLNIQTPHRGPSNDLIKSIKKNIYEPNIMTPQNQVKDHFSKYISSVKKDNLNDNLN